MATLPDLVTVPHPGTEVVEDKADAILDQDHATISNTTTHKEATDEISFRFLHLPMELQTEILNSVSRYSDLKALCLVSKEISDTATPRLFYEVDLKKGEWKDEDLLKIRAQIKSLLVKPANLQFVRVLKTPLIGFKETQLMGRLLPLLRTNFLTEFSYTTRHIDCFPTPQHLQFLLNCQKNLQNLRFYCHMIPSFNEFLTRNEPSRSVFLSSFTKLNIENYWSTAIWPLVNLDMSVLQSLHIGNCATKFLLSSLNAMLAKGCFGSLTQLKFEVVKFHEALALTNTPSLKRLILKHCKYPQHSLPLVLPDGFKLPYLWYSTLADVKASILILAQIRGLEHLFISFLEPVLQTGTGQADLARAIVLHKNTLRTLDLTEELQFESPTNAIMWEYDVVRVIGRCHNLVRLSLPLVHNKPPSYYRSLAGMFPDLVSLTVYDIGIEICSIWTPGIALQLFPAASKLEFVSFKGGPLIGYNDNFEQRFVRKDLEKYHLKGFIEIE